MKTRFKLAELLFRGKKAVNGFTILELMVAITIMGIVATPMAANYISQKRSSTRVRQTAQLQQQLRGAIYIMEQDIRTAGFYDTTANRSLIDDFGVIDVRRYSITDGTTAPAPNAAGSPCLSLTSDWNDAVPNLSMDGVQNDPVISYRLFDESADGFSELARDIDATRTLLSEQIQAIGFAYAFDADGDGQIDRSASGNILWAVDSDNDNTLDTSLDTNDDGVIDLTDDGDGNLQITSVDNGGGGALPANIPLTDIRMIRIWLLGRSTNQTPNYINVDNYVVGDRIIQGNNDGFKREAMDRIIVARNLSL